MLDLWVKHEIILGTLELVFFAFHLKNVLASLCEIVTEFIIVSIVVHRLHFYPIVQFQVYFGVGKLSYDFPSKQHELVIFMQSPDIGLPIRGVFEIQLMAHSFESFSQTATFFNSLQRGKSVRN